MKYILSSLLVDSSLERKFDTKSPSWSEIKGCPGTMSPRLGNNSSSSVKGTEMVSLGMAIESLCETW
jgi:hypothetical protein